MSRVYFDNEIIAISGKSINKKLVFMAYADKDKCIGRKYVAGPYTEFHANGATNTRTIANLWNMTPDAFKQDFKKYAKAYNKQFNNRQKLDVNAFAIFFSVVHQAVNSISDLDDLATRFGQTLQDWMNNSFLRKVRTTAPFTARLTV
jgi:hypothetical protein